METAFPKPPFTEQLVANGIEEIHKYWEKGVSTFSPCLREWFSLYDRPQEAIRYHGTGIVPLFC
jgi:hypothetical protein